MAKGESDLSEILVEKCHNYLTEYYNYFADRDGRSYVSLRIRIL